MALDRNEIGNPTMYLGDGVYASYDGFHIILTNGSHDNYNSEIFLDIPVFTNLILFAAQIREPKEPNVDG